MQTKMLEMTVNASRQSPKFRKFFVGEKIDCDLYGEMTNTHDLGEEPTIWQFYNCFLAVEARAQDKTIFSCTLNVKHFKVSMMQSSKEISDFCHLDADPIEGR